VSEAVAVEARFEADGRVRVLAFERRGRRVEVASSGRQWDASDGRHILVMAPSEKVYELLYQPALAGSPWRLVRSLSQGNLTA
jgi:hypothetical protein